MNQRTHQFWVNRVWRIFIMIMELLQIGRIRAEREAADAATAAADAAAAAADAAAAAAEEINRLHLELQAWRKVGEESDELMYNQLLSEK